MTTPSLFGPVARFEWRFQLRNPVLWVGFALFFLLTFGATTIDQIQIGSRGNVNINSPYAILQTLGIMSVFSVFIVVGMVAGAVLRDDETGFAPILHSTRLSKGAYLGGRFTGALAAALLVLAAVPLGIALGSLMPWLDAEKIGPFVPGHYLWALCVIGLPTLVLTGAAFFALATATRSMMWTYVCAVGLLVLYFVSRGLLKNAERDAITALTDPFGLSALTIVTKYWTASDRNTRLPDLSGIFLANRLIWLSVGLAIFAIAAWRYRIAPRPGTTALAKVDEVPAGKLPVSAAPHTPLGPHGTSAWAQFRALARFDMVFVFRSPAFFVLLGMGVLNAGGSAWFTNEWYGSGSYPVTRLMTQALQGAFGIMPILIAIYYAGELVWRDRERRMHEIIDAAPAPEWAHLVPKIAAIALVLIATCLVAVATGVAIQLAKGYTRFQLDAYLLWFVWPSVVSALQLAVLSVFVQVLVPQKFIGWGVMLLQVVALVALASAGFEHNLYLFGGTPSVPLSDMNGQDRFWIGQSWLQGYWSAFSVILAVVAYAFWRRGLGGTLRQRWPLARGRLAGGAGWIVAAAAFIWIGTGGFIYWNTNVLNSYVTKSEQEARKAAAEKILLGFEKLPQPTITDVALDVQLYPQQARVVTRGTYHLVNRSGAVLTELHVASMLRLKLDHLDAGGVTLKTAYPDWGYRIYALTRPMQPGEARDLTFTTTLEQVGFSNGDPLTRVVSNGTFVDNIEIAPFLGVSRDMFLKDRAKRRKYGLPADLRPPVLEDDSGRAHPDFRPDSEWVNADLTVTTDADQTPVAPGYTLSDTVHDGRRTVHFRPDAPINHFFSIQSARYAVRHDSLGAIDLAVYYQPGHDYNVDRMLAAMKTSLQMFSERFSPYQFRQARILEFPSYASFAQSFANTIPYSENIGFLTHPDDANSIDIATYVTAHEIGHQWWGHQLAPSWQQGGTMLVESFAQYSALLVMERMYGPEHIRRFLKYELDKYLSARGTEAVEELPLARVENQPYIHYQKGALVMWWLKDALGEDVVDRAMRRMLQTYAFKGAPYPNSLDFLRILREEAGPGADALITDLFERITLYDLKASGPSLIHRNDGRWDVSFQVDAHKRYADGTGKETEAPMDEVCDIGVFTAEPGKAGYGASDVLLMRHERLHTGTQTVTVTVDRRPAFVGVDPYNKRIDRNSDDNLVAVATSD